MPREGVSKGACPLGGSIVIVGNALLCAAEQIDMARFELPRLLAGQHGRVLNSQLYVSTLLLQSVLDGVACLCQKVSQLPGQGNIYFDRYPFVHSEVVWVAVHQRKINALVYDGVPFYQFANRLKHERPWVGAVSCNGCCPGAPESLGVHDGAGVCYLYGVLIPAYKAATEVIARLCRQFRQPSLAFPSL